MSDCPPGRPSVGRGRERAIVAELVDTIDAGRGGALWIEGEAGIGKSHLGEHAVSAADARGHRTCSARARELDARRPFGVLADCFGVSGRPGARTELHRVLHGELADSPVSAGTLQFHAGELLLEMIEKACSEGPLLLALDDLQWADPSSLDFLARYLRDLVRLPVAVVGLFRPVHRRELAQLVEQSLGAGGRRLRLGALAAEESALLGTQLIGARLDPELDRLVGGCGGNPLLITTLLRALKSDGAVVVGPDGTARAALGTAGVSLRPAVITWLSHLSAGAQEVLGLAAVLGASFTVADLSLLSGRPAAALWPPLREALAAGVLDEDGESLGFVHDVVHEALYDDLPASVRQGLHADFAQALAQANGDLGRVAEHTLRGARRGDLVAVDRLRRAARQAAPRGPGVAAELLDAALALLPAHSPDRVAMELELARAEVASGRLADAEALCRSALDEGPDPEQEGTLRLCLIDALMRQGRLPEVIEQATTIAGLSRLAARDRAMGQTWLVMAPLWGHDIEATVAAAEAARTSAQAAGHAGALAQALSALGQVEGFLGHFGRACELMRRAVAIAVGEDTTESHVSVPHLMQSLLLVEAERLDDARRAVAGGRRIYERLGVEPAVAISHQFAGNVAFASGEWDDALAEFETATTAGIRAGTGWQVDCLVHQALIRARRGELDTAAERLALAREHMAAGAPGWKIGWPGWVDALMLEAAGHPDAALATLRRSWDEVTAAPMLAEQRAFAPDLMRLLSATGDRAGMREVADALARLCADNPDLSALSALAASCAAMADTDVDALVRAAEQDGHPFVHQAALAHEAAAVALAKARRPAEAERSADKAFAIYERLGAGGDAARLRKALRVAGLRRATRGSRARPTSGPAALTVSERRVARLVAQGLSNPEIAARLVVSRHTVATHVSHVLAKLGLRTRVELAASLARDPLGE
jgi:DNA-binding CsgD family transcriptional regulator/tetratricopeptide (TPR) repeat protein